MNTKIDKIAFLCKSILKIGMPASHEYKEETIAKYSKEYGCNTFVETGTYKGDMLIQEYKNFEYLASVEIAVGLFEEAKNRFNDYSKVHLYNGNSSERLPQMIDDAKSALGKAEFLFWLDGHYSGGITGKAEKDTPIIEELLAIKNRGVNSGVILIDDARCFTHKGEFIDYPTIKALKIMVKEQWPDAGFKVKNDIIRITLG